MNARAVHVLLVVVVMVPWASASAQIALRGGVNLTDFVGGDAGQAERARGLNLGASLALLRVSRVQLAAEVYYREKGAAGSASVLEAFSPSEPDSSAATQTHEIGIDYVEVPVLARVDLGRPTGRVFPYLLAGPAFGWRVGCGVVVGGDRTQPETRCGDVTENLEDTLRRYELGVVLGGGVDFALPRDIGALNLDARYTGGLSRIGDGAEALDIRNRAFTVMLGWSFGVPRWGGAGGPLK